MQNDSVQKELIVLRRVLIALSFVGVAVLIAVCVYFPLAECYSFLKVDCVTSTTLHIYCPGCGATRAVEALLHGRLLCSLARNPIVIWIVILATMQYVRTIIALCRRDLSYCRIPTWSWVSDIVLLLTTFVVRNLLMIFCGIDTLGENLPFWNAIMGR